MARRSGESRKPKLIVMGPVPPPIHGVAVSMQLALENDLLRERYAVEHIDTTDRRPLSTLQRWDVQNVALGLRNAGQLARRLRRPAGLVYLPLSAYWGAFLRDSLFIHTATLARWKVAVHIGNTWFREFYEERGAIGRWWIRFTLRRISTVAVRGERVLPALDGLVARDRLVVVHIGTPECERLPVVRRPGRVLYLGNFLAGKGIVEAVEAALIVLGRDPDAEVVFAGAWHDPSLEGRLRARAAEARGRIRFLPPVSGREKEELLQSSDLLFFPARENEAHARVILEAMCRGLPIVTTAQANYNLGLEDGTDAFVLPGPDPAPAAERVVQLLADEGLRARMGAAARAHYEREYTQARADQRLADWLAGVVPGDGA
jgi:glycosyltransferase involved in cell wall biosynthesis